MVLLLVGGQHLAQPERLAAVLPEQVVHQEELARPVPLHQGRDALEHPLRALRPGPALDGAELAVHAAAPGPAHREHLDPGVAQQREVGLWQGREVGEGRPLRGVDETASVEERDAGHVAARPAMAEGGQQLFDGRLALADGHHGHVVGEGLDHVLPDEVLTAGHHGHPGGRIGCRHPVQPGHGRGQPPVEADHRRRPQLLETPVIRHASFVPGARRSVVVLVDHLHVPACQLTGRGGHTQRAQRGRLARHVRVDVERRVGGDDHAEERPSIFRAGWPCHCCCHGKLLHTPGGRMPPARIDPSGTPPGPRNGGSLTPTIHGNPVTGTTGPENAPRLDLLRSGW